MNKVYIFDVDGTLTPSRLMMTKEFAKFFDKWSNENKYYLVTGSDIDKTKEQLPIAYMDRAEAIFTCCGNQMWRDDELIYNNKFNPPKDLRVFVVNNKIVGCMMRQAPEGEFRANIHRGGDAIPYQINDEISLYD